MTIPSKPTLRVPICITPPGSITADPLTPPPTDPKSTSTSTATVLRIIEDIKAVKTGRSFNRVPESWTAYKLDAEGYRDLQRRLQRDESLSAFVKHELRYDYFPSTNRFILRMPGDIHELFTASVAEEIRKQLNGFSVSGSSADFVNGIITCASRRLVFEKARHDPDMQFQHESAGFPGVVIEVSHSQKKRDLPHLADTYILGSEMNIQVVVGLDIEYTGGGRRKGETKEKGKGKGKRKASEKGKLATISVWVPKTDEEEDGQTVQFAEQTVESQPFRDHNGNTVSSPTSDLRIPLRDFAPPFLFATLDMPIPQEEILIPAQTLCDFLHRAERMHLMMRNRTGIVNPPPANPSRKRYRRITPDEELEERDEKRFRGEEDEAAKTYSQEDPKFTTPSVGRGQRVNGQVRQ